jgi:adenosylmethionine-8-amino-7-oxononanoate aminotransferase
VEEVSVLALFPTSLSSFFRLVFSYRCDPCNPWFLFRYRKETGVMEPTKAQLERWDLDHVWHPFTPVNPDAIEPPLIIDRAEGCHLFDIDGRRYIDGVSSLWCNVHGHRVPELDDALRAQLDDVAHSTLLGLAHGPAIRLARRLVELAPAGLDRVFFSDNGSTAVEVALKMAFQYWRQRPDPRPGKTSYLAFSEAYHGDTVGSTSLGGIPHFHALFGPLLFPTVRAPNPHCYRCPLGLRRESCQVDCAGFVEDQVRQHHQELAAVVVEPLVQGAAGMVVAPEGYLRRIREVTRECGVLLIADEVAVGFGRTGTMFACEQEQVVPDFLCVAKGLTGGYLPLAATLTTREVYSAFLGPPEAGRAFYHGHTYTGNPLAAAVALANLELFESRRVLETLVPKIDLLGRWLNRMRELPAVGDVRQKGLMAGIELVSDRPSKAPYPTALQMGKRVCLAARRRGALLRPLGNVVVVMPPLAIEEDLLERLCEVVYRAIEETCREEDVLAR